MLEKTTSASGDMSDSDRSIADPYSGERARNYDQHHRQTSRARSTTRREQQVLARALQAAGQVQSALDLPCGAGRFWPVFAQAGIPELIAGDVSAGMLSVADGNRLAPDYPQQLVLTSALDIELPDKCVDFTACMRFYHHLSMPQDRLKLLQQLCRVTRSHIALTLWVDGNLGAWRRSRKPSPPAEPGYGRRICRKRSELAEEFGQAGLSVIDHFDVWPGISMWRLYLLKIDDVDQQSR